MIIAFAGVKFSGKDTAAEGLIDRHKFVRIGLADKLKDIVSKVLGIDRASMDDPSKKELPFSEPTIKITNSDISKLFEILEDDGFVITEDAWRTVCNEFVGKPLHTVRECLQVIGTDIVRTYVADDIWLQYFDKIFQNETRDIVCTDARFPNERKFLKARGAVLVLIKRPGIASTDTHISENQLGDESDYDLVVTNKGSITELQSNISIWWTLRRDGLKS